MATLETPWGPNGKAVYDRTYSRQKANGKFEIWPETVSRVARGNLSLVYGDDSTWSDAVWQEFHDLCDYMERFAIIPAGRQLWASGVEGRQFLFNCHVSGWGESFSEHFAFTFMRLVEGGGVGANYSTRLYQHYGAPKQDVEVHIFCREDHPDYAKLEPYLSRVNGEGARPDMIVEDTREGWATALSDVIDYSFEPQTMAFGVVIYDLSNIRPEGSPLISSGGVASGPAPLAKMLLDTAEVLNRAYKAQEFTPVDIMEMDHVISVGAIAGGKRRSARMSMCHWEDPYIMEFLTSKEDGAKFWTTNISVEIDNDFIEYLNSPIGGTDHRLYQAHAVHQMVCEQVLKNGEPGYWNSDLSNEGEPGLIIATNPCGEIPLMPWENCNLGHVNLDAFVDLDYPLGYDVHDMIKAHKLTTRFLMRSTFGDVTDSKQRAIVDRNRRIGVGHLGVQAFFAKTYQLRYSEIAKARDNGLMGPRGLFRQLVNAVDTEAVEYAHELRIPVPVKKRTVAPTGSTAKMPGTTEGISAVYALWFEQRIRFSMRDEREFAQVQEYMSQGYKVEVDVYDETGATMVVVFPTENTLVSQMRELGLDVSLVESQDQISVRDMLEFQAFYQEVWADNAVSYTVNIPEGTVTPEELSGILLEYLPRLKGTTIMVDATRQQAPYTRITQEQYAVADAKRQSDAIDLECATGACPIK